MTILVIEDDPGIAQVVTEAFATEGRKVEHCATGEEGLDRAAEARFDAIVLDVLLPAWHHGVAVVARHTALGDALVTGEVFLRMIPLLAACGIRTLRDAREATGKTLYARIEY